MNSKGTKEYFIDWYHSELGYGYGTGDEYYCKALIDFFQLLRQANVDEVFQYNYKKLENEMGGAAAWFIINIMCGSDLVEYGTSPRYGWLTPSGELMRDLLAEYNADSLYELVCTSHEYTTCMKDYCNHTDAGNKGCKGNPFFYTRLYERGGRG